MVRRQVTLYTRAGCHLCDEAKEVIEAARKRAAFDLDVVDIDADPELRRLYNDEVPVIAIDGVKAFKYRLSETELLKKLQARSTEPPR
jgi:glutaredoxin